MSHGNAGFRVKNLHHTKNCTHKETSGVSWFDQIGTKARFCMANGCNIELTPTQKRGCHVVSANQNTLSGQRFIVAMCDHHNKLYDVVIDIRLNATECALECKCGHLEEPGAFAGRCPQC